MDQKEIGTKIRQYRKLRGMTQEQLAKSVGISTMSIRRYESGERIIAEGTLRMIAFVLQIAPSELDSRLDRYSERVGSEEIFTLSDGSLTSMPCWADEAMLLRIYNSLNAKAKKVALERLEELTKIPDYQIENEKELEE